MFSALTAGLLGGGLLGSYLSLRATQHIAATARTTLVYWAAAIGIALAALPAAFLALTFGGSVGGGTGPELGTYLGAVRFGASTGVVLGVGLVLAAALLFGAAMAPQLDVALGHQGVGPNSSLLPSSNPRAPGYPGSL